jgi:hypothetical protein
VADSAISASLYWADGLNDVPLQATRPSLSAWRASNAHLAVARGSFAPGERYALLLDCGESRTCEALLTATSGAFVDNGPKNDGFPTLRAVQCDGKRYNLQGQQAYHVFTWRASPDATLAQFDVTMAVGEYNSFLRMPPLALAADAALRNPSAPAAPVDVSEPVVNVPKPVVHAPSPPPSRAPDGASSGAADSAPAPDAGAVADDHRDESKAEGEAHDAAGDDGHEAHAEPPPHAAPHARKRYRLALVVHAWLGAIAFLAVMPASVAIARYARAAAAGAPAPAHASDAPAKAAAAPAPSGSWLVRNRVVVHWRGGALAAALLAGSYGAVLADKAATGGSHLVSTHSRWGLAALVLVAYQLQGGLLRPPAGAPPTAERARWRLAHAACGAATLLVGWVAAALALLRALEEDVQGAAASLLLAVASVGLVVVAAVVAETYTRLGEWGAEVLFAPREGWRGAGAADAAQLGGQHHRMLDSLELAPVSEE